MYKKKLQQKLKLKIFKEKIKTTVKHKRIFMYTKHNFYIIKNLKSC